MMSDFALKSSDSLGAKRRGKLGATMALAGALILGSVAAVPAQAQGTKIGFVNTERILRESAPAKAAQSKIESNSRSVTTNCSA